MIRDIIFKQKRELEQKLKEKFSWFGVEGEVDFVPARKWLQRK